ncbi:4-oxalocrotonate tautomerase family protein (plasmid) [Rhizobium sp. CC1099]|nr:4-oxalocrotonate tautomerase family protein [Rhizobium sp. CC1099]WFU91199.1 4-oxalocrotonate tautomerase family protein [Rhizobium sp. CC1099]
MPFVNIKTPEGALNRAQKQEIVHRTTNMLVEYFSEAARPHTMVLIEEVKDGGYGRADEIFILPDVYRSKENSYVAHSRRTCRPPAR